MRRTVRNAATLASVVMLVLFAVSCDDDDISGLDDPDYTATLIAANEVNPPSNATGTGIATFVDRGDHFEYSLSVTGLTGVTASHIHGPAAAGVNAGIIVNLFVPTAATGAVNGVIATGIITDASNPNFSVAALRTLFDAGNSYVNVHTTANAPGAIRGQIVPAD